MINIWILLIICNYQFGFNWIELEELIRATVYIFCIRVSKRGWDKLRWVNFLLDLEKVAAHIKKRHRFRCWPHKIHPWGRDRDVQSRCPEKFSGNNYNSQRLHSAKQRIDDFPIKNVHPRFPFPSGKGLCSRNLKFFFRDKALIPESRNLLSLPNPWNQT